MLPRQILVHLAQKALFYIPLTNKNMDLIHRKLGTKVRPSLETANLSDSEDTTFLQFDFPQILKA